MDKYNHWVDKDDLCKLITSKSWLITMTTIELDSCLEKNANNIPCPLKKMAKQRSNQINTKTGPKNKDC